MSMKPLSDYCEVITKGTTPKTMGIDFVESGIPFIKIENINEGRIVLDSGVSYIDEAADKALSRSRIYSGDVLISIAGTIGKTVVVPLEIPRLNCNQAIAIIRPKKGLDSQYLKHWLASPAAIEQINGAKVTATIANLSLGQIGNLNIDLPPLEEQKRIAAILDKADSLRRKRAQAIALADDFLRATFLDLFGDPVTNPKGWPVKPLHQLCEVGTGGTPSREVEAYYGGDIPWVKTGEVDSDWITTSDECITERALAETNCKLFPPKTILVAMYGQGKTRGKAGMLGLSATTNQACAAILPSEKIQPEFLLSLLKFSYESIRAMGRGGNQENLNLGMIKSLEIIVPDSDVISKFMHVSEKIKALFENENAAIGELDLLNRSMQWDCLG